MSKLPKNLATLTLGMKRVTTEWISSCLYGFVIIATLMAMTALYIVLNELTKIFASISQVS